MCGTPMPHRPITAPGAQSTLTFTRIPVDSRDTGEHGMASQQRAFSLESARNAEIQQTRSQSSVAVAGAQEPETSAATPERPAKELVPDIPLDEYIQKFRYEPPTDPTEITMRGEEPVTAPAELATPVAGAPKATPTASTQASSTPASSAPSATSEEDVDRRLGLEPETPVEARIARPRFLDINEPPKEGEKEPRPEATLADSGTSTIGGPSFLGLSDPPQTWASSVGVEEGEYAPSSSHWRAWLAIAVVLVLAVLGVMEWRSQVNQTDNGPVQVIRAKIRSLRQSAMSEIASESAPAGNSAAAANDNSKPEMQVQEQPKPQPPSAQPATPPEQPASAQPTQPPAVSSEAPTEPSGTPATKSETPAPKSGPQPKPSQPAPAASPEESNSKQASTITAQKPPAAKPSSKRQAEANTDDQEVITKQFVPGGDEMTKAKNASDSAAEAAWLWKATAKGNPDAPVELANMYIQGDGVPRSCEQAMVLLKTAAAKENAHARNRLASMYATGTCVQRNRVEAYRWLSSALTANPSSQWAQQNRDLIWRQMTPDERVMAEKYR